MKLFLTKHLINILDPHLNNNKKNIEKKIFEISGVKVSLPYFFLEYEIPRKIGKRPGALTVEPCDSMSWFLLMGRHTSQENIKFYLLESFYDQNKL